MYQLYFEHFLHFLILILVISALLILSLLFYLSYLKILHWMIRYFIFIFLCVYVVLTKFHGFWQELWDCLLTVFIYFFLDNPHGALTFFIFLISFMMSCILSKFLFFSSLRIHVIYDHILWSIYNFCWMIYFHGIGFHLVLFYTQLDFINKLFLKVNVVFLYLF